MVHCHCFFIKQKEEGNDNKLSLSSFYNTTREDWCHLLLFKHKDEGNDNNWCHLFHSNNNNCRNPNLGLVTRVEGLQGCGPRGSLGVIPHALGSVRDCEGMNPHTPEGIQLWELEFRWTPKFSEGNFRGQNSMTWKGFYTIGKFLECRCLKWDRIAHLDI
jgi:hypothetical protein